MKTVKCRSNCPISNSLDFIGDKWSLLIVRDMVIFNKKSYNEFLNSGEGIATNILGNRLKFLEKEGFVVKRVSSEKRSRNDYFLTEKGIALIPILFEMIIWGRKFCPNDYKHKIFDEITENKSGCILKYRQNLRKQLQEIEL